MLIKSQKDFFAGLLFIAIGLGFAWGATDYELSDTARMGPGYFPMALGALLAALGAVIAFKALVIETADGEPVGRWAWRPLFFVTRHRPVRGGFCNYPNRAVEPRSQPPAAYL